MLMTWMQDKKSHHWSLGLQFVQLMKNQAYHAGIKYEAVQPNIWMQDKDWTKHIKSTARSVRKHYEQERIVRDC